MMMTMMVMTAARNTNPPKMPSAIMPPMLRRAAAIFDGLVANPVALSLISLSCTRTIGMCGRDEERWPLMWCTGFRNGMVGASVECVVDGIIDGLNT